MIVVIVSYGTNRFAAGSLLVVIATALKTVAAVLFAWLADGSLATWGWFYLTANSLAAIVTDAEMLFYIQSELDKVMVLALGGPETAGIYAIIMRLVDLTALPARAFLAVLTQRLMRTSKMLDDLETRVLLEGTVAVVSTAGLLGMAGFL